MPKITWIPVATLTGAQGPTQRSRRPGLASDGYRYAVVLFEVAATLAVIIGTSRRRGAAKAWASSVTRKSWVSEALP